MLSHIIQLILACFICEIIYYLINFRIMYLCNICTLLYITYYDIDKILFIKRGYYYNFYIEGKKYFWILKISNNTIMPCFRFYKYGKSETFNFYTIEHWSPLISNILSSIVYNKLKNKIDHDIEKVGDYLIDHEEFSDLYVEYKVKQKRRKIATYYNR